MLDKEILKKLKAITPEEQKIIDGQTGIDRTIYMDTADNIISSKKIMSHGKQISIRPHTRFIHFPLHSHDYVEIIYMCSGKTKHIINGDEITLKEGELLFLCQSASQEVLPAEFDDVAINFIVLPEFFDSIVHLMGEEDTPLKSFIVNCLKNKQIGVGYLHFEVSDILPVQNLLENLICTIIYDTPNKRNINQITMALLFMHLINHTNKLFCDKTEEHTIVKVLRYIEENYQNGSLSELSEILHYDISVLSREIKHKTGKNYTELVQEKRLSQAAYLIKNTGMSVNEVALKTGYENISFFYRIFKEKYGVSPGKYRQSKRLL